MKKKKLITGISFFAAMIALSVSVYAASYTFIYDFDSVLDSAHWRTMAKGSITITLNTHKVYKIVNGQEVDVTQNYRQLANDLYVTLYKQSWYGGSQYIATYANYLYPWSDSKTKTNMAAGDYRMKLYKDSSSYGQYVVGDGTIQN